MTDQPRILAGAIIGASLGCVAAFLFWTRSGRVLRRRMEFALEDFGRELVQLRGLAANAANVASEGRRLLDDFNERSSHRQTRPF